MVVSTAGGMRVARGYGLAWAAQQVRALLARGYPAFVRSGAGSVELRRAEDGWVAVGEFDRRPPWASDLVDVLNETESKESQ